MSVQSSINQQLLSLNNIQTMMVTLNSEPPNNNKQQQWTRNTQIISSSSSQHPSVMQQSVMQPSVKQPLAADPDESAVQMQLQEEQYKHQSTKGVLEKLNQDYLKQMRDNDQLREQLKKEREQNQMILDQYTSLQANSLSQLRQQTTMQSDYTPHTEQLAKLQENLDNCRNETSQSLAAPAMNLRSPFDILKPRPQLKQECVKQLQYLLMVSDQLYTDFGESVSVSYERLNELSEKIDFVIDLKEAVMDDQLLKHIPETNYRTLLTIIFKLCTSITTQKEIS